MAENENADSLPDVEATESWLLALSRELGRTLRRGKNGIDLLVDATGSALSTTKTVAKKIVKLPRQDRGLSSSEEALFEELGSKVAACPGGDYSSLQRDAEFWELVKQLHSIRGKVTPEKQDAPEGAAAEEPKTAEPPTEG